MDDRKPRRPAAARLFYIVCLIILLASWWWRAGAAAEPVSPLTLRGEAFGIAYHIQIAANDAPAATNRVRRVVEEVFAEIDRIYNKWNSASEVSALNRADGGVAVTLSEELYAFLERTGALVAATEGRFDPAVEAVARRWREAMRQGTTPPPADVEALAQASRWDSLTLYGGRCTKRHGATALDLGGHAKGYAVDVIVERLRQLGYRDLYVEWGGEIACRGRHPSGRRWRVAISHPAAGCCQDVVEVVELCDQAIATSGDYEQKWLVDGQEYCHIFSPEGRCPMKVHEQSIAAVSVVAPSCCEADVWATALMTYQDEGAARRRAEELVRQRPELAVWIMTRSPAAAPR